MTVRRLMDETLQIRVDSYVDQTEAIDEVGVGVMEAP
jgi:hypothetical protein